MADEEVNDDLVKRLRLAKTKELQFAFVGTPANGRLILAEKPKTKPPRDEVSNAKKVLKNNRVVMGLCSGPLNAFVCKVEEPKNKALVKGIKDAVERDANLTIRPELQPLGQTGASTARG